MENCHLLISDLDGTLLGREDSLAEFAQWYERRRAWLRIVYSSGRLVDSVAGSVATTRLPEPDAVIGGVGTQIRCSRTNQPIGNWPDPRENWQPLQICSVLCAYDELELQPAEFLSDYKISYYVNDAPAELIDELHARLAAASCHVELLYSSNRDLDVLPKGVNKGSAAAYLAAWWSIPVDRVLVSGDSGNDLAMFQNGFRGIVVGNAHRELRELDSPSIYQSNRTHAAGVLEGLRHWLGIDRFTPHSSHKRAEVNCRR